MEREDFYGSGTENVGALHDITVEKYGDTPAITMGDRTMTHAELRDRSAAFAGGLAERGSSRTTEYWYTSLTVRSSSSRCSAH